MWHYYLPAELWIVIFLIWQFLIRQVNNKENSNSNWNRNEAIFYHVTSIFTAKLFKNKQPCGIVTLYRTNTGTGTGYWEQKGRMKLCGSFHITPEPGQEPRPIPLFLSRPRFRSHHYKGHCTKVLISIRIASGFHVSYVSQILRNQE